MNFSIRAHARQIPMSARKMRLVINLVRGKPVQEALALLQFTPNAAAAPARKLVASAAANAEENYGLMSDELFVAEIMAGEGRMRKKGRFGARGRFKPEISRSCHVSVALREINPQPLSAAEAAEA
ncbi:MAG TPA: 50S ribosomal protein L22 [Anaerolineae bacterium]|nr:50S ribosomal protein L22 [Anaerolineae bacterium]